MPQQASVSFAKLAERVKQAASESLDDERNLVIRVESILKESGVDWGRYEYNTKWHTGLVSGGRIDSLHSSVLIEYEVPRSFELGPNVRAGMKSDTRRNGASGWQFRGLGRRRIERCGCVVTAYPFGKMVYSGCAKHRPHNRHICQVCSSEFKTEKDLRKHRWQHSF